ncbi:Proteasomal ubiquitin receptor ADRM1 [Yarrowia sp. B02]|nr:Proteasomal ubiquitin receptor ADRM1 [Yarrowia sp. B02]
MATTTDILFFKAGQADFDEETSIVTPRRGQGRIVVTQPSDSDELISFVWEPRGTAGGEKVEVYPFAGDATFQHVPACKTGRVFKLQFESSGEKLFYWAQTPTDSENVWELSKEDKRVLNTMQAILEEQADDAEENAEDVDMQDAEPESAPAANPTVPDLASLMRNIQVPQNQSQQAVPVMNIGSVVGQSKMAEYIGKLDDKEVERLCEMLPDAIPKTRESLISVVQSPQFAQGMGTFDSALREGAASLIARELGQEYTGEGVEGYLESARKAAKKE